MRRNQRSAIVWMLTGVMTFSPALVYAEETAAATAASTSSTKLDLGYITPQSAVAAAAFPRRVLTAPEMEMFPIEVLSAAAVKELGLDPLDIEQALLIAEPPANGPPQVGLVLHMASPLPTGKILGPLWETTTEGRLDGKPYRQPQNPMQPGIFRADDHTLIVATDDILHRMLANHATPAAGPLSRMLGRISTPPDIFAVVRLEPVRPLLAMGLAAAPVPPPLVDLKKIPDLVNYVAAKATLVGTQEASLTVRCNDEAAAKELEDILNRSLEFAQQTMLAEVAKQEASSDPVDQAAAKYARRTSKRMFDVIRPVRKGSLFTLGTKGGPANAQLASVAVIGVLVALLLPAIQAAREAGRRITSANNLKQIGLAMHTYHDAMKSLPTHASFDKNGKPLLSWRVHMLPYMEYGELYKQFHLDEPWNSEHNRKLIPLMPREYQNPSAKAEPGKTHYLAVCGKGLVFDGEKGHTFSDVKDGTSNTIMVVEVNEDQAVSWTKPDDWEFNAARPLAGLGRAHPSGFNTLFVDGSVRFISATIDPDTFKALLTIAGGEDVNSGNY